MIRLSCWIGGVGCVPVDEVLAQEPDRDPAPVMQNAPVKRCIDSDIETGRDLDLPRFVNAAPRLARHFPPLDVGWNEGERDDEHDESGLEIWEVWRKCRDRLLARDGHDGTVTPGKNPEKEAKASCLTDAG